MNAFDTSLCEIMTLRHFHAQGVKVTLLLLTMMSMKMMTMTVTTFIIRKQKCISNQTLILIFVNSAQVEHSNTKFTFVSPGFVENAETAQTIFNYFKYYPSSHRKFNSKN